MLKVGDRAPAIDAMTSNGTRFVLSEQRGLCTVIYFFPKAFTPICTVEAKLFRDNYAELSISGVSLVGISVDDLATQCSFAESVSAPFPIVPDADRSISRAYDVLWPILGIPRRVTYVVDDTERIEAVFRHEFHAKAHRNDVLRFVNDKFLNVRKQTR